VLTPIGGGIDPQLSISDDLFVSMCALNVPVNISIPSGEMVYGTTINVTYDPSLMDFESATRGAFWTAGAGWSITANEVSTGLVQVTLFNTQASAATPVAYLRKSRISSSMSIRMPQLGHTTFLPPRRIRETGASLGLQIRARSRFYTRRRT